MMNKGKQYKVGQLPEEGHWRICPECGYGTLIWQVDPHHTHEHGRLPYWLCECGYKEALPEEWTIPFPKGFVYRCLECNTELKRSERRTQAQRTL